MNQTDQELIQAILREINAYLNREVLPVHSGHLEHLYEGGVLKHLLLLKKRGLISGDLITRGTNSTPFKMTNIRLTYLGIKSLRT